MAAKTIETKKAVATKATTKNAAPKAKATKPAVKKEEVKKAPVEKKENKKKESKPLVQQMTNSELKKLFNDSGCETHTKAKDESDVVYNTFGTRSRVLQQKRAYQLLLTNGHKKEKEKVVECANDDTARFISWYNKLSESDKAKVSGFAEITKTKLSDSELPRERTVKINDYDLLVKFLKFMAGFEENKLVVAK